MLTHPEKSYNLLTVLNGMCKDLDNPRIQRDKILSILGVDKKDIDVNLKYIDKTKEMEDFVINSALSDKEKLGCAGVCSGCKCIMEISLAETSKKLGSDTVTLGYVKYQGIQEWVEQTPEQMHFLEKELEKKGVHAGSPLYDVIEYPFDAVLLLSAMGMPYEQHKQEMTCEAGGINPKHLDKEKLHNFLTFKVDQIKNIHIDDSQLLSEIPDHKRQELQRLIPNALTLKNNPEFVKESFSEDFEEDSFQTESPKKEEVKKDAKK